MRRLASGKETVCMAVIAFLISHVLPQCSVPKMLEQRKYKSRQAGFSCHRQACSCNRTGRLQQESNTMSEPPRTVMSWCSSTCATTHRRQVTYIQSMICIVSHSWPFFHCANSRPVDRRRLLHSPFTVSARPCVSQCLLLDKPLVAAPALL